MTTGQDDGDDDDDVITCVDAANDKALGIANENQLPIWLDSMLPITIGLLLFSDCRWREFR